MKKTIAFCLFFNILFLSNAQTFNLEWQKNYGGSEEDEVYAIVNTTDGGYLIGLSTGSNDGIINVPTQLDDIVLLKTNAQGDEEWQKKFGGSEYESVHSIINTNDGGYILAGSTSSNDGDVTFQFGLGDVWIIKIDSLGNLLWQKTYGGSKSEVAHEIVQTSDGGYIFVGFTSSDNGDVTANNGLNDYWIVKIDLNGSIEWQKTFGGSSYDIAYSVIELNGNFIVVGKTGSSDGDISTNLGLSDFWVLKISSDGTLISERTFGGTSDDEARQIIPTSDGGYIIAGSIYNEDFTNNHGAYEYHLVKIDTNDVIEWEASFGGNAEDISYDIVQTIDNGYIVCGSSYSNDGDIIADTSHGGGDIWLIKTDDSGNLESQIMLGGSGWEYLPKLLKTPDFGIIIAGHSRSSDGDLTGNYGDTDAWIVKLGLTLSLEEFNVNKPSIYPNPAKEYINIPLSDIIYDYSIYTILGEKITLKNKFNSQQLDISMLSPGVYLLVIDTVNNQKETFKFIKE